MYYVRLEYAIGRLENLCTFIAYRGLESHPVRWRARLYKTEKGPSAEGPYCFERCSTDGERKLDRR